MSNSSCLGSSSSSGSVEQFAIKSVYFLTGIPFLIVVLFLVRTALRNFRHNKLVFASNLVHAFASLFLVARFVLPPLIGKLLSDNPLKWPISLPDMLFVVFNFSFVLCVFLALLAMARFLR